MLNLNSKSSSHQRISSDVVNGIQKTNSIDDQLRITIVIHANSKLEKMFPNDINANIDIKCGQKKYSLNKAHLRVESQYFQNAFEDNENQREIILDSSKLKDQDEGVLEKVLRCLYGGKSIIAQNELYQAYTISQELKIDKLVNLLNAEILKHFSSLNFFTIFQLAVTFNEYDLLKRSKESLEDCSYEILKDPSNLEKKHFSYPLSFVDLDVEAIRKLFNFQKDFAYLSAIETFELLKEYNRSNSISSDINVLIKEFLPQDRLTSAEYCYIRQYVPIDDQSLSLNAQIDSNKLKFVYKRPQTGQESNIIFQLESENIYYQKKVKEMEMQNQKLQDEMVRMKQEIEIKTDEFNKKEESLQLKLSNIENSVKQFEALDKGKEQEYNRKMQKLFKMIKEREAQLTEKDKQCKELYQVLSNFTFQKQDMLQQIAQQQPQQNEQVQHEIKSNTHQGFFNRPSSLQNYPETQLDNHKMKSSDSSLMTTQNSIIYVTGGMQQSTIVPLSDLESMNHSYQSHRFNRKNANNPTNQKLHSTNKPEISNLNFMNNFMSPMNDRAGTQMKAKGINNQELINSLEMDQNEPITKITGLIENDEDTESTVMTNFLTFMDSSKVLEDCNLDYKTILSEFFELSPFKKMSLQLIYRASRDTLTKESFDKKVCNVPQTVVFIKSWEYFKIFGAYLSIPWSDEQGYQSDDNAFLFSISDNIKIPVKNADSALYQGDEHIFSFGTNDLSIFEKGDQEEVNKSEYPGDYQEIETGSNGPLNSFLAGCKQFQVDELEVYKIILQEDMDF